MDGNANVRDQQLKVLQETIRNLQTQLLDNKTKEKENLLKIIDLEEKLKRCRVRKETSKDSITSISDHNSESNDSDRDVVCVDDGEVDEVTAKSPKPNDSKADIATNIDQSERIESSRQMIDVDEARLIGLISSFLVVHPFGASLDNILTYVQQVSTHLRAADIEQILRRYKSIFSVIDAMPNDAESLKSLEQKWLFCGFEAKLHSTTIVIQD